MSEYGIYWPSGTYVTATVHSKYWQVVLASIYVFISALSEQQLFEVPHIAQFSLHTQHQLHSTSEPFKNWEANFSGKLYWIDVLWGLVILDLCIRSEETWTDTGLARHCEEHSL